MNILVVDDDPIILDLLKTLLNHQGFKKVSTADSADKAVELIRDTRLTFHCLLLDMNMPKINGVMLCELVRQYKRYINTCILMIADARDQLSITDAFSAGASDFIGKPLDIDEISKRLQLVRIIRDPAQLRQLAIMRLENGQPQKPSTKASTKKASKNLQETSAVNLNRSLSEQGRRYCLQSLLSYESNPIPEMRGRAE